MVPKGKRREGKGRERGEEGDFPEEGIIDEDDGRFSTIIRWFSTAAEIETERG